jgi:predicted transglutaminase-like cysteine proteinase
MKKLIHMLLLSCRQATELIEKKLHGQLSWREEVQLKAHKMICEACSRYEQQSSLIEKGIGARQVKELKAKDIERLKQAINQKLENRK